MPRGTPFTAPSRQRVFKYLTPRTDDTLFFEEYDKSRRDHPPYGTPHPLNSQFPNHRLCHIESTDLDGDFHRWWYIKERTAQDEYNWEFTKADVGGTKFNAVMRTYITPRYAFTPKDNNSGNFDRAFNSELPATGAVMSTTPTGVFTGTYVLADRKQARSQDPQLDSLFVVDQHTYIKKSAQIQLDYDEQFGGDLSTTQTLYYATEIVASGKTAAQLFADADHAYWGLQSTGVARDGRQLSAEWYAITEKQVISKQFVDHGRTYTTAIDFYWPGVLSSIEVDAWVRKAGGEDSFIRPIYSKEAYRGPCKAVVTESFHVTAPTPTVPNVMLPLPININTPLFAANIGPTLHGGVSDLAITTGPDHPIYDYNAGVFPIAATTPTTWPSSILASDEVRPLRGGYLRTSIVIYPPTYTAP